MISYLLSHPVFFNGIRAIIAGDQRKTKEFVKNNLMKYGVKTVLDVGCGTGDFVEAMPGDIAYLGIDMNKKYIAFAKKEFKQKNIKFVVKDVTQKSFYANKKFDAVIFVSMLHHLSDDELAEMLPVIKKITKKVVIVVDLIPNPEGFWRRFMVRLDQGKYIRPREEKIKILSRYFKVKKKEFIPSRLAIQYGIICSL